MTFALHIACSMLVMACVTRRDVSRSYTINFCCWKTQLEKLDDLSSDFCCVHEFNDCRSLFGECKCLHRDVRNLETHFLNTYRCQQSHLFSVT